MHQDVRSKLGIRLMRSERWFPLRTTEVAVRVIPYIYNGHISSNPLGYWKCSAQQHFATICRMVFEQLKDRFWKSGYKHRRDRVSRDFVAKVSIYYALTYNGGHLERLIRCNTKKASHKLLHSYTCAMDEQKRFLYGQMLSSILWLQSRGNPRAKSILKTYIPEYRRFLLGTYDASGPIKVCLNRLGDPWIVNLLSTCGVVTRPNSRGD